MVRDFSGKPVRKSILYLNLHVFFVAFILVRSSDAANGYYAIRLFLLRGIIPESIYIHLNAQCILRHCKFKNLEFNAD